MKKQQIIIGEKIKAILNQENGKKLVSFRYQEKTEDHVDLICTWINHEFFLSSKTLLADLEIKIECVKGHDICLISLSQITKHAVGQIISYYKQNCRDERISDNYVQEILEKLELSKNSNKSLSEISEVLPEIVEQPEETIIFPKEQIEPTIKAEIITPPVEPVAKPAEPISKPTDSKPGRGRKKSKLLLSNFFLNLCTYEKGFDSPTIKVPLSKYLNWEHDGDLQILLCHDEFVASSLEMAGRWHLGNNFTIGPKITRKWCEITLDCSNPETFIRHKKVTTRSFCLPPNEGSTLRDMEERLHRVYYVSKPVVQKMASNFLVKYPKRRLAKSIYEVMVKMGWEVGIEDNILIVHPIRNSSSTENEEKVATAIAKEFVSSVAAPVIEPAITNDTEEVPVPKTTVDDFDLQIHPVVSANCFFVINSKEEALTELKRLYYDPILYSGLSEKTKNDAFYFLAEDWRKNNTEEYARVLLDFLKNN